MSYDNLGYDQLALKASHNSYDRDEDIQTQLRWNDDKRYNGGCRSVEFDIVRHSDSSNGANESYFQVTHDQGSNGPTLASYFKDLLSFHEADTGHDPILVCLDIKSKEGSVSAFVDEIDTYLRTWFDESLIYAPGRILELDPALDLVGCLQKYGWPLLSTVRGKFLFCLGGYEEWKKNYATTSPSLRLCFADFDVDDTKTSWGPVTSGPRAVANLHLYSDDYDKWKKLVPNLRGQRFLVRGWVVNSSDLWKKAQSAGVNDLATDKISDYSWAVVGNAPLVPSAPQVS